MSEITVKLPTSLLVIAFALAAQPAESERWTLSGTVKDAVTGPSPTIEAGPSSPARASAPTV
jgi:hypothetical protein